MRARPSSVCMCAHSCDSVTTPRPLDLRDCCCQSLSPLFHARLRRSSLACVQARARICLTLSRSLLLCVSLVRPRLRTPIWLPELTVSRCAHLSGSNAQSTTCQRMQSEPYEHDEKGVQLRKVSSVGSTHIWLQHAGTISNIYGKSAFGAKSRKGVYENIWFHNKNVINWNLYCNEKHVCLGSFVNL